MLREHHRFFLPNLLTFANGNTYLGSFLGLRFRVKPTTEEVDGEKQDRLACLTWYGEYCLEESEIVSEASFPLTAEGREQVIDWLEQAWYTMKAPEGKEEG